MTHCSVCNGTRIIPFTDEKWEVWGKEYSLARCEDCGSAFTNPLPDDMTLSKVYDLFFDYRWYADHFDAKYRDAKIRIGEYGQWLGKRVLDFGGGVGYFSQAVRELGLVSKTYDPFCNKGEEKGGEWDTVVALNVLEHSNDLERTLGEMKSLLAPSGTIILAVPNFNSQGYKELGSRWVWAQPPLLHLYHFTAKGLTSLLERHGFVVDRVYYAERWDANLYADMVKVKKYSWIESLWKNQRYNKSLVYRKVTALLNTKFRYAALEKALKGYSPENESYAELQVIAHLGK